MRLKVVYTVHERTSDGNYGQSTTHIARSASGIARPPSNPSSSEQDSNIAVTYLKSCLALICYTRPDLIPDASTDYSISVLDIAESAGSNGRVFEGQGMMGWILAEKNAGSTCITGRLAGGMSSHRNNDPQTSTRAADAIEDVLEVVLELKPRKPIPRKDFLSTLSSSTSHSIPPPSSEKPPSAITLPDGTNIDSSAMLAMLQTLFNTSIAAPNLQPASVASDSTTSPPIKHNNDQLAQALFAAMPLLPGINLFNPPQARSVQQEQHRATSSPISGPSFPRMTQAGRPKGRPSALKTGTHTRKASASSSLHPMSGNDDDQDTFTFPATKNGRGRADQPRDNIAPRPILPAPVRHPMSEPNHSHSRHESQSSMRAKAKGLKYWPKGCILCFKTESHQWRVQKKRKQPLYGSDLGAGNIAYDEEETSKLCEECAVKLPSKQAQKKKRKAGDGNEEEGNSVSLQSDSILALNRTGQTLTSPLRRSPRRHPTSGFNRTTLLSAQPLTSPTGSGSRNVFETASKRRKFTTALSAAALREEGRVAGGLTPKLDDNLPRIPSYSVKSRSSPQQTPRSASTAGLGVSIKHAKEVFGSSTSTIQAEKPKAFAGETPISHEDESFNFFLNASPSTIMRSFNVPSPKKGTTPGAGASMLGARTFPALGTMSPMRSASLVDGLKSTSAVFSPLGSSLSTPFRALLQGTGKCRERATSEQPPASHSRLYEELLLRDAPTEEEVNGDTAVQLKPSAANQFISSDDNLLGSTSNVQINLLPATADRRNLVQEPGNAQVLSDSIMKDFGSFFLNSSSTGLFSPTPFASKVEGAGKLDLAPLTLQFDAVKQQSLSPLATLSSEMDIDLSNLPPSSPPPLPASYNGRVGGSYGHISQNSVADVRDFWSNFNAGLSNNGNGSYLTSRANHASGLDDGQSPISVTTSITQGGTPQDTPISHDTGPSEPPLDEQEHIVGAADSAAQKTTDNVSQDMHSVVQPKEEPVDPLFEYFSFDAESSGLGGSPYATHHQRQSSASSVSSAFLDRLKKSTGTSSSAVSRSSSSMGLAWSDGTAVSSSSMASMPVTDLTARSRLMHQQQKTRELAKMTNVPINSADLMNEIDCFLDLDHD